MLHYRILTGTVISLLLLVFCVLVGIQSRQQAADSIYRETKNTSRLLLTHFEDAAAEIGSRLKSIAEFFREKDFEDIRSDFSEYELQKSLKSFSGPSGIAGPGVLDRHGMLFASGVFFPVPQLSLADRPTFRVHAENPGATQLYISPTVQGRLTPEWSIHFSYPLRNKAGMFAGVILYSYKLTNLAELYRRLELTKNGLIALSGPDGLTRIRIVDDRVEYDTEPRRRALVSPRASRGEMEGTFYRRAAIDGVVRIGSFVVSGKIPFYVLAAYGEDYFRNQYISSWIFLGTTWLAVSGVMFGSIAFLTRIERIRQESAMRLAHEKDTAAEKERQNILADLHDSIGSRLTAMLSAVNQGKIDLDRHKHSLSETLTELRLLVDTNQEEGGNINLTLADVRYRLNDAITQSGIELHWEVDQLPHIANFSAGDGFMLKLAMLEAISNVIHHSRAKDLFITAVHDCQSPAVVVSISDNGCGFDPAARRNRAGGLTNMRKRVARISTGAAISIEAAPGKGTTIRIRLGIEPQDAAPRRPSP